MKLWQGVSAALAWVATSAAPAQSLVGNPALDQAAATMRPGQFMLDADRPTPGFASPDLPSGTTVTIAVSIALQRLYVYRGNELVAVSTVSTGRPGKRTPFGDFTILQKARWHRSNIYSNAPMPFMQRLTWTGIALHAGHDPGYPASHGCIRLPWSFARDLFSITSMGTQVTVSDYPQEPQLLPTDSGVWASWEGDDQLAYSDRPHWYPRGDAIRIRLEYSSAVHLYEGPWSWR